MKNAVEIQASGEAFDLQHNWILKCPSTVFYSHLIEFLLLNSAKIWIYIGSLDELLLRENCSLFMNWTFSVILECKIEIDTLKGSAQNTTLSL